jgi:hypothetical protein
MHVFNERDDAAEADVRGPDYVAHAPASLEPAPPWRVVQTRRELAARAPDYVRMSKLLVS